MGGCSLDPISWGTCLADAINAAGNAVGNAIGNAGNAVGGYISSLVQGVLLIMYQIGLSLVVSIIVSVGATFALLVDTAILTFSSIASTLGIFAMPFLTIAVVALASGIYLAFEAVKDAALV